MAIKNITWRTQSWGQNRSLVSETSWPEEEEYENRVHSKLGYLQLQMTLVQSSLPHLYLQRLDCFTLWSLQIHFQVHSQE